MDKYIIAYAIVYSNGEIDHGVERFNNKRAASTYERFLKEHTNCHSILIYNEENT